MQIKSEDGILGFPIKEGWFHFVIEQFAYHNANPGETSNVVRIPLVCIDEEGFGARLSLFCDLTRPIGRRRLAALIGFSGIASNLEKIFAIPSDLKIDDWVNLLDPSIAKNRKLIDTALVQLVGKIVKAEVKRIVRENRVLYSISRLDFPETSGNKFELAEDLENNIEKETEDWE